MVHAIVYLNIQIIFAKLVKKIKIYKQILFKYFYQDIGCELGGSFASFNGGICQNSRCICQPYFSGKTFDTFVPATKKTTKTTTKTIRRILSTTTTRSSSRSTTTKTTPKITSTTKIISRK